MMEIVDFKGSERSKFLEELKERATVDFRYYEKVVQNILARVKAEGDPALLKYTEKFDGVDLSDRGLRVTDDEIDRAYGEVSEDFLRSMRLAIRNITDYHKKQSRNSWFSSSDGIILGQKVTPIASVGIYVPGGTAAYPSSVLMNAIPAKEAGVKRIVMVTPPNKEGQLSAGVLVAARELEIDEIYKIGGAQAVGALAYGTESIEKVNKIVGPGNIYVATAKREVYGYVDIDMIAGPSEILIIADDSADAKYIAADLLSQAEHDELSSAILITISKELGDTVIKEVERQVLALERKDIIEKSLANYGKVILAGNLEEAVELSNKIAPEHLELCVKEPFDLLNKVENAGAIFLGNYSPESLGDYLAGPNHVLPTSGTAKFYSPLSVDDFIKKSSIIYYNREALQKVRDDIMVLAEAEGLTAHKNSIKVRFE